MKTNKNKQLKRTYEVLLTVVDDGIPKYILRKELRQAVLWGQGRFIGLKFRINGIQQLPEEEPLEP